MAMPTEVTSCDSRGWARGIRQLIVAINVAEKRETKKKKKGLVSEHWIRGEREKKKREDNREENGIVEAVQGGYDTVLIFRNRNAHAYIYIYIYST